MDSKKIFEKLAESSTTDTADLLRDEEILSPEDSRRPAPSEACGTDKKVKPKKPCANCTCGLADELENKEKEKVADSAGKPSCGSCYLGDAFRCASCPYRGMPAFKPGEKVTIDTTSDDII